MRLEDLVTKVAAAWVSQNRHSAPSLQSFLDFKATEGGLSYVADKLSGRISPPYGGVINNLQSASPVNLATTTTGLIQTLGKYAVGGLATLGIGAIFLSILLAGMAPTSEPTIPLGCAPNFIKTRKRAFWGIILDDELSFETEGQTLTVPFDFVSGFGCPYGAFSQHDMHVRLVDGSEFKKVRLVSPTSFRLTTLAGIQSIPFEINEIYSKPDKPWYKDKVEFTSPTVKGVEQLRQGLQTALDQNATRITQLIGPDILRQFFNTPSI